MSSHRGLNTKENRELKRGIEIIRNQLAKISLAPMIPRFNDYIDRGIEVYTVSFCEERKSEHASERYGEYCLEFNEHFLEQFKNSDSSVMLSRVKYNHKEQEKIILDILDLYEQYTEKSCERIVDLLKWLSICIPLFKEEEDHLDNECRVVAIQIWSPMDFKKLATKECQKTVNFDGSDVKCLE